MEQLSNNILNATGYQHWRSTKSVIKWFNSIPNKDTCHFLKFDGVEFYPSIGENLLNQALNFAKTFQAIAVEQIEIIQHCRKSLLFDDSSSWVKRENEMFDVTMGLYDGAEVCELVGLFMLVKLSNIFGKNLVSLYRDDGLAVLRNCLQELQIESESRWRVFSRTMA